MLAGSLVWMSPDIAANYWTECRVPDGGVGKGTEGAEGVCSPVEGATVSTGQTPTPDLPGTGPLTKEYTWRVPWLHVAEDGLDGHQ